MFTIIKWLTKLLESDYQSQLDQYISSHAPQSAADVEYLERQYSKINRGGLL